MHKIYSLLLPLLLLSACQTKQATNSNLAHVSGNIKNSDITTMMLVNINRTQQDTVFINRDGTFEVEVDASEKHLFTLFYKREILEMYLEPGDKLEIYADAKDYMTSATFKGSAASKASIMKKKLFLTSSVSPQDLLKMDPNTFTTTVDAVGEKVATLVDDSNLTTDLKRLLKVDAFFALVPLRDGYASRKMTEINEAGTEIFFAYQQVIENEINEPKNLESTAFQIYLSSYLQNELMGNFQTELQESDDRWAIVMLNFVPEIIENQKIRDYSIRLLYREMMMGRMTQMPDNLVHELVDTYLELVADEHYEDEIKAEYEAYQIIKEKVTKEANAK